MVDRDTQPILPGTEIEITVTAKHKFIVHPDYYNKDATVLEVIEFEKEAIKDDPVDFVSVSESIEVTNISVTYPDDDKATTYTNGK